MRKKKKPIVCPKCGEILNVGALMAQSKWDNMSQKVRAKERARCRKIGKARKVKPEGQTSGDYLSLPEVLSVYLGERDEEELKKWQSGKIPWTKGCDRAIEKEHEKR